LLVAVFVDKLAGRVAVGLSLLMRPLAAQKLFLKKRLAEHPPVRIMRDLGGGSPRRKTCPSGRFVD